MRHAELYEFLPSGRIRCLACARRCQIGSGQVGLCGIRQNVDGRLELLVYGRLITGHVDPIEKKPVTHYRPGSRIFSVATSGCSWLCQYCQNFDISQRRRAEGEVLSNERVVEMALQLGCQGIAYTYNEPTIYIEYSRDIGRLAHSKGLFNIFVSNGYATPETVTEMAKFLDCLTVDFKGSGKKSFVQRYIGIPDPAPIFETLLEAKRRTSIHLELTDLVVPEVGDDLAECEKLSKWVYDNLGPETPIHFLRFHPDYRMLNLPSTPVETLERHYEIAKKAGLKYVYIGNVPGHEYEDTYCAGCGYRLIDRDSYDIVSWNLTADNRCPKCGEKVPIRGGLEPGHKELRFVPVF